tara:strand:+ start:13393 stop:13623 length:231 start_codon:yes stop_codon:yes gene_type:complete
MVKSKEVLIRVLTELKYIEDVILSCETLDQYSNAINWFKRWSDSRKKILLNLGLDNVEVEKLFKMKHIESFEYNLN